MTIKISETGFGHIETVLEDQFVEKGREGGV